MRRFWDTLAVIIVATFVMKMVLEMVRPYVPLMLITTAVLFVGRSMYFKSRNW